MERDKDGLKLPTRKYKCENYGACLFDAAKKKKKQLPCKNCKKFKEIKYDSATFSTSQDYELSDPLRTYTPTWTHE